MTDCLISTGFVQYAETRRLQNDLVKSFVSLLITAMLQARIAAFSVCRATPVLDTSRIPARHCFPPFLIFVCTPLKIIGMGFLANGIKPSALIALHLELQCTCCGNSGFAYLNIGAAITRALPLLSASDNSSMRSGRNERNEIMVHRLEPLDIDAAVSAHVVKGLLALVHHDLLPETEVGAKLFAVSKEVADVVELVAIEVKILRGQHLRVDGLVDRNRGESVLQDSGAEPWHIEMIAVVMDHLVRLICDLHELFEHLLVALVLVPSQNRNIPFAFPLVADADDLSLLNNGVVVNVKTEPC